MASGPLPPYGTTKVVATATLTNAHIFDTVQHGWRQTVSFVYEKIEWTWLKGGVTFQDDWFIHG